VLHASAVSIDGKAAIFLGPRGAGKSTTTAAAFGAEGYSVLEDDVVAIRFDEGVLTVVPGVPQLRLKSDAAAALGVEDDDILRGVVVRETDADCRGNTGSSAVSRVLRSL